MTRFSPLAAPVAAVAIACVCASGVLAKDYDIRLTRPVVVGQRYKVSITVTRQSKSNATINGKEQEPEEETSSVSLTGTVEVLQISRKGTPLTEEYAVEKCTQMDAKGNVSELLPKGCVITVQANNTGPITEIEGYEVDEDEMALVGDLFSLNPTEITDDDVFGTKTKHAPGDTWGMNAASAQKLASVADISMDDITGKVTFVGVKKAGGVDCLELSANWSVGKLIPPAESLPPKFSVSKSTLKANTWGLYPVDGVSLPVHEKVTEEMQRVITGTNANKQKIASATAGRRIREIKRFPLTVAKPAEKITGKEKPVK